MTAPAKRSHPLRLEIAVQDAAGARTAFAMGADRVELCQALAETGGLTPSAAAVDAVLEAARRADRVAVLVRPRPGGFVYDTDEIALIAADVRELVRRGAGAVVVGALDAGGRIDVEALSRWTDAADGADVVFHRAIDTLSAPEATIDQLAELGIRRVLTSGGAPRSIDGLPTISALARRAAGRVQIMSGGGVRVDDIPALVGAGVDAVHLSARRPSGDRAPSGPGGGDSGFDVTDETIVAAARAALDRANSAS
ncbi:copper homeostasis protein CutC [Microbacterium sp. KUDC0406]|uniref:copper homeostasis protein CutC n=1 Tax=Microbacterium sp. KUDC0406 TaxID=2909588 RepID=UPI001F473284|nr:copper homeostasis protein CutC [Microbacterium sp. KUDC0406]UJP11241.1 copper homeostasis protein CutC [Microbacterium sp. KUDC0406]